MSYLEVKPQYYQMHMPDSPWHAGSKGWKSAPWPSFGVNPNLVGPPRLAVEGLGNPLGAYFKPEYEKPISGLGAYFKPVYETPISGLGRAPMFPQVSTYRPVDGLGGGCGCGTRGVGDGSDPITTNAGGVRYDVIVPVAIIASITAFAVWVSFKK